MESKATFIGTNGIVALNAISAVHPIIVFVIHPGNPKGYDPIRLGQSLKNLCMFILGILHDKWHDRLSGLLHGLMKLGLARIAPDQSFHEMLDLFLDSFILHCGLLCVLFTNNNTLDLP
jgi:hypothetical protein